MEAIEVPILWLLSRLNKLRHVMLLGQYLVGIKHSIHSSNHLKNVSDLKKMFRIRIDVSVKLHIFKNVLTMSFT